MKIAGFIDASTKDWPKKAVSVIFTVGCNYKCKFCHNKPLLDPNAGEDITSDLISEKIEKNFLVDGVSITGGEPTLQKDLIDLCKSLRRLNKEVSVDTNGSHPEIVEMLLPYVNRIALDLKAPLDPDGKRLKEIANANINPKNTLETIEIVQKAKNVQFEIRTTYVKKIHNPEDIKNIINLLKEFNFTGDYVIQQYQYSEGVGEENKELFEEPSFEEIENILNGYYKLPFKVFVRAREIGYKKII
jgi:pyruvate formate lyase activating enzyme